MAQDDFSKRAARGQAYNLAVMTACAEGKQMDNEFITKQFLRHLEFANILQRADVHQLAALLSCPKLVELLKELDKHV